MPRSRRLRVDESRLSIDTFDGDRGPSDTTYIKEERSMSSGKAQSNGASILDRLVAGDLLISDGATGTYLQTHGLEPGGCPEEFNASHPEVVQGMARAYFDAGSDMVLTNSFGGSRFMLKKYGHGDRVREFNCLAAQHAKSVAPDGRYVIGSIGPTGEFIEPLGAVSESEMYDAMTEQATALAEGGADAILIETQMAIEEVVLGVKAVKEHTDLPAMATMVFDMGPRGFFTMMGVTPERAVEGLREAGADVIGANCGNGIDLMVDLARQMRAADDGLMLIQSNAGMPTLVKGEVVYNESPEFMAERYETMAELGVNILGGCCGTGPDHIRELAKTLRG